MEVWSRCLRYDREAGRVTISSAKRPGGVCQVDASLPRFAEVTGQAVIDPLEFLARLAARVPPAGTHLIRYDAYSSTRRRAARRGETLPTTSASADEQTPAATARRRRWARLLRLVFEIDPLVCPACGGAVRLHLYAPCAEVTGWSPSSPRRSPSSSTAYGTT